jgi:hypothetical protein
MEKPKQVFFEEEIPRECLNAISESLPELNEKFSQHDIVLDTSYDVFLSHPLHNEDEDIRYAKLVICTDDGNGPGHWRDEVVVYQMKNNNGLEKTIAFLKVFPSRQIDISHTSFPNLFEYLEKEELADVLS